MLGTLADLDQDRVDAFFQVCRAGETVQPRTVEPLQTREGFLSIDPDCHVVICSTAELDILLPRGMDLGIGISHRFLDRGNAGDQVVVEVEAKRIGSSLDPVIELLDPRGILIAWSQGTRSLSGDARVVTTLPVGGNYQVVLRDVNYAAKEASLFRLKIGDFHFAASRANDTSTPTRELAARKISCKKKCD
mgnify:CR=1 FL=1